MEMQKIENVSREKLRRIDSRQLLAFLLVTGLALRVALLDTFSLWFDEAVTANAALSLLENGIPELASGMEYWRAFPHTLLAAVSAGLLGASDFALRLPSAIIGTLTIGLTYLTGKQFSGREAGLIATAFVTFSVWQIAWSTQVRMYVLLQFLYLAAIYLTYRCAEDFNWKNLLLLTSTTLLAIFVHVTAYILPFVASAYLAFRNRNRLEERLLPLLFIPVAAVLVGQFFYFDYPSVMGRMVFEPGNFLRYLGWLSSKVAALSVLGLAGALTSLRKDFETAVLPVVAVLPAFYIYSFHVKGFAPRYLYFMVPFLAVWSGIALTEIAGRIEIEGIDREQLLASMTLFALLFSAGLGVFNGAGDYRPVADHKSAYSYVESQSEPGDVLVTQWTAPAVYYFRAPDYSLFGDRFSTSSYAFNGTEMYSGAEFLVGRDSLAEVVLKKDRGWLVLQDSAYATKTPEIKQLISRMRLEKDYRGLRVWSWNGSFSP